MIQAFKQLQYRLRLQKRVGERPFADMGLAYYSACTSYLIYVMLLSEKKTLEKMQMQSSERGVNA